jgi:hypothetical protein
VTDYDDNARSIINSFLWDELKSNLILNENDYRPDGFTNTITPIIPVQQLPEINNLLPGKPFILYDYEIMNYGEMWWICEEKILYTVVSTSISEISKISEFIVDLFRRKDLSGKDIQSFNTKSNILKFYAACLESVSSPEPFETEGGKLAGTVEISYKYSRDVNSQGRFK